MLVRYDLNQAIVEGGKKFKEDIFWVNGHFSDEILKFQKQKIRILA